MGALKLVAVVAVIVAATPPPAPTQRVLNIPWHHQRHNLSCEAAALAMALTYYGIAADELTLIRYMTKDPRPAKFDATGRVIAWGDPAQGFVGDPDGRIERYTGYGVYYQPVALAAMLAGANVLQAGSVTPKQLYDAVLAGHPALAWISNTYHQVQLAHYVAYDGATGGYTLTQHAVPITRRRADAGLIHDPWFGQAWHPKAQFESAYRTFDGMAAILEA